MSNASGRCARISAAEGRGRRRLARPRRTSRCGPRACGTTGRTRAARSDRARSSPCEDALAPIDLAEERTVSRVELRVALCRARATNKREQRQLGLGDDLHVRRRSYRLASVAREVELLVERLAKTPMPCILMGSETRRPRKSRESSGPRSQKSVQSDVVLHRRQVARVHRVGAPELARVAYHERSGAVREEEALVRVERDRVGAVDPRERVCLAGSARRIRHTPRRRGARAPLFVRDPRAGRSGSIAPVLVVPAAATIMNGAARSPRRPRSPRPDRRRASSSDRRSGLRAPERRRPAKRAAFRTEWCA